MSPSLAVSRCGQVTAGIDVLFNLANSNNGLDWVHLQMASARRRFPILGSLLKSIQNFLTLSGVLRPVVT
jgi:hypothetical protein